MGLTCPIVIERKRGLKKKHTHTNTTMITPVRMDIKILRYQFQQNKNLSQLPINLANYLQDLRTTIFG